MTNPSQPFSSVEEKQQYIKAGIERLFDANSDSSSPFYDPSGSTDIAQRYLPHWEQEGKLYFITFRQADSIPAAKLRVLKHDREEWARLHPAGTVLTEDEKEEYNRLFNRRVQEWLDQGYGSCELQNAAVAKIVADSLCHFHGSRYELGEWVIMPNHVHVVARLHEGQTLDKILHSWKSYSANVINRLLRRTGIFWEDERHDHIIRSYPALFRISEYIIDNPQKGNVSAAEASWLCATLNR